MTFKVQGPAVGSGLRPILRPAAAALGLALACCLPPPAAQAAGPTLLIEAESGKVLHAAQAFEPWYPASLTKMMTALVAFRAMEAGRITLHTPLLISQTALSMPPSKIGFPVGSAVTLEDGLRLLMVKSANDIAVAIAEGVSGSISAFADEMNITARELGMTGSNFVNPNGLPDERQFTTARDFALLARAMLDKRYSKYHELYRLHGIQFGRRLIRTHNSVVVRYPGATGLKTGFVCSSGYNVVASAKRDGRELIAVVLGARSGGQRAEIAAALFEQGFEKKGDLFATDIRALQPESPPRAAPLDLRPYNCRPRKKMTPEEAIAMNAVDPRINLDRGRQALGGPILDEPDSEEKPDAAKVETPPAAPLTTVAATPVLIPLVKLFRPAPPEGSQQAALDKTLAAPEKPLASLKSKIARKPAQKDLAKAVKAALNKTPDAAKKAPKKEAKAAESDPVGDASKPPAPAKPTAKPKVLKPAAAPKKIESAPAKPAPQKADESLAPAASDRSPS